MGYKYWGLEYGRQRYAPGSVRMNNFANHETTEEDDRLRSRKIWSWVNGMKSRDEKCDKSSAAVCPISFESVIRPWTHKMDIQSSHLLPRQALDILHQVGNKQSGVSGSFAWLLSGDSLHIWRYQEGPDARVRSLIVPLSVAGIDRSSLLFVSVLPQPRSSAVTVVICSASGTLAAWMDANYLTEPIVGQIATSSSAVAITSFSAAVPEEAGGSGPVFVSAAGGECCDARAMQ